MKTALVRNVLLSAGLVSSAFVLGSYWGLHAVNALNGLRSAGPFTHEEEAAFIRSRILLPIIPPEWVSGVESNELIWIKYEMLARCGLTIAASVAIIFIVRFLLRRKNGKPEPNQALETTSTAVVPPAVAGDRASGARGSS